MNVQLFGNIDNKTYQAPRINLMQKVQEKGATPLTFKETIKGLNDANVSVSISDEGLKALHGSKLQGAIDPMETAKQIEYMSNHQPVESFSNRFAQMLPSNYEMNDQGEKDMIRMAIHLKKILIRKKLILNMQIFRSSQLFVCILNIQNKPLNF